MRAHVVKTASAWRGPRLHAVPKKDLPMKAQDCVYVRRISGICVSLQIRLDKSFVEVGLSNDEVRQVIDALSATLVEPSSGQLPADETADA